MSEIIDVAVAYRQGRTFFMGLELLVAPGALVPRPETELLGAAAVAAIRQMQEPVRVIDMCCGAGNLACAIAMEVAGATIWASDLTDGSVDIARLNVEHHGLSNRVSVQQGDLFDAFGELQLHGTIDLIVCNPPYISESRLKGDLSTLLELEPREAFAAGPYGLNLHMRVINAAAGYLRPGGLLMFEVGLGQHDQVSTLFKRSKRYEHIRTIKNDAGEGRVVAAILKA